MRAPRSGFVTAVAWVFIVLGGFATAIAIMQNVMLTLFFPADEMRAAMQEAENAQQPMPPFFRFMFENFRYFFLSFLVVSVVTLVSAIGLLRRKNWARLTFVVIMALGIAWNLASIAMPFMMTSMVSEVPPHHPQAEFYDNFELMWNLMMGFTIVIGLVFAAVFAWIIKRLLSEDIRREFTGG